MAQGMRQGMFAPFSSDGKKAVAACILVNQIEPIFVLFVKRYKNILKVLVFTSYVRKVSAILPGM